MKQTAKLLRYFIHSNLKVLITHHHYDHTLGIKDLIALNPEVKIYKRFN